MRLRTTLVGCLAIVLHTSVFGQASLSVCNDSLYLRLMAKDLNELTEREFQYVTHRETLCLDSLLHAQPKVLDISERPAGAWKVTGLDKP